MMNRRWFLASASLVLAQWGMVSVAQANEAPDALIKRLANDLLTTIKADPSLSKDIPRVMKLVDTKLMPSVNFTRMTASAVGKNWRSATPEQQAKLQENFKLLLVRTYSGALSEVKNVTLNVKPLRMQPADNEVVVKSELKGRGEPISLDYRLEKVDGGWKIYDLNVEGIWLVDNYKSQFTQEISAKGIDGLIATLAQRNKAGSK